MSLSISSPAFAPNARIPSQYTCDGSDISPPLSWKNPPAGTKSYALIMEDPDAPSGIWDHWILFNIPANQQGLSANTEIPAGAMIGLNSWGNTKYQGPCPPSGTHHYYFKLYALDTVLSLNSSANKQDVINAMQDHILAEDVLIGLYTKP
ncbi:YbhB/YbcL family Raf kinase inhibitor-like protein [Legionella oakridgensis]|uniref:Raf kinase inhibitor-like protein, YbhB/YbcL family n=2 Tax=Legionella oakridgensis TaxID=29423 RepID=W0BEW5_9GAMM|nr:YbhB/YbcL family Raf kinase inhibitor-like protein [Legionella oakridgensis]AHE67172.1 Raf kinase inhibitor-like protein, YbhB/YbcL family [Legionella oakridgensis ATCC 33761 = DSM 21215]ETO93141.1 phospholipid-binding protein, PBP family [Legionella oakridgensis RV-2-2007]KTD38023.1 phosphatidylethanolamine-binding protein PebP [Legionella oakridgensis]STY20255.1 phosphatidylethanolamine-binding protein PebP [Legionella longbeachae]